MEVNASDLIARRIQVLEATETQFPLLAELAIRANESVLPNLYRDGTDNDLADVAGRAANATILVALFDDFVIGGVTYQPDGEGGIGGRVAGGAERSKVASLSHLCVDPSAQRLGAGRALVEDCIGRTASSGRSSLVARSLETMNAANHLFANLGFVRDEIADEERQDLAWIGLRLDLT